MRISGFRHIIFALLATAALLPMAVPGVIPLSCAAMGCRGDCSECACPAETGNRANYGCCSNESETPPFSSTNPCGTGGGTPHCLCAGLCSSSACPSYADVGTYLTTPFLPAHFISASLNPSDYIFEEPQPPRILD
ncbi:hypothetical protein EHM69_06340 [candidate division KSB1 bacterium]|nr:MAG: hypothetical protein EHM69_06340 [candidate division KSB1 bacterium]